MFSTDYDPHIFFKFVALHILYTIVANPPCPVLRTPRDVLYTIDTAL